MAVTDLEKLWAMYADEMLNAVTEELVIPRMVAHGWLNTSRGPNVTITFETYASRKIRLMNERRTRRRRRR